MLRWTTRLARGLLLMLALALVVVTILPAVDTTA